MISACISRPANAEYKNAGSLKLLAEIKGKMTANGWRINNIDATVIAEKPYLREYIDIMRERLQQTLAIPIAQVSVKASTANRVGALGNGEAIAAMAIASIQKTQIKDAGMKIYSTFPVKKKNSSREAM